MNYDVKAKRLELSTLVDVKAQSSDLIDWMPKTFLPLPDEPNTASNSGELTIYWIGQDHWLLRTSIDQEMDVLNKLDFESIPAHISAVLVSDTLNYFELVGKDANEIISIASPLDVHLSQFPENGVSYTEAFGLKVLLIRSNSGFELAIDRSYADMFEDCLNRAGAIID